MNEDQGGALSKPPTEEEPSRTRGIKPSTLGENFAACLRGFGPLGVLSILIVLAGNFVLTPLSGVFAVIWAWLSRTPWREIGYVRPRSWPRTIAIGIVFGVALKVVMKSIVMPLLGAPPVNAAFHYLTHNPAEVPAMLYLVFIVAGFGEETLFRGWAFERFGKLLGNSPWAKAVAVLVTSAWFGYAHYAFQGLPGVENAAIVALVFGTVFAITRRLFLLMIAHVAFDLAAFAMIYWDCETAFARFFFK